MSLKILYAGSPDAAAKSLEILFQNQGQYEIVGVLSNPPSAKGRHKDLIPTPVAAFALENNIPLYTPEHLDSAAREEIKSLSADLLVCFAYGHIFGPKFLATFPMGGINLHPSLLPKYRGCSPVNAAILNGDSKTAISIQTLSLKMDEGDILAQEIVPLKGDEKADELLNYCAQNGAKLIVDLLNKTSKDGKLPQGKAQTGEASYTGIISKEDGKINWTESAKVISAKVRAYYPEPGCWCLEKINNQESQLRILSAKVISDQDPLVKEYSSQEVGKVLAFIKAQGILIQTGDGLLCVSQLQRQGKKAMMYKDFMNGARDFIGSILL
ncbi:MAG: methionyl-tRNA formyltransferase [Treponema sp.]|nr:methionyl-tRNA formyltransferase [Treponema sp.]